MSTKIHQLVDGLGRPLVAALTAGQSGDSPMLKTLLANLSIDRIGPGRPRTRPAALLGDKLATVYRGGIMLRAITIWLRE